MEKNGFWLMRKKYSTIFLNTFAINPIPKRMKYFRIRMTDKSWQNHGYLEINSLEIYGKLLKDKKTDKI